MYVITERVAPAILKARRGRGWSQAEASKETGIPQSTLSRMEAGHRIGERVTPRTVDKLAVGLGIPDELFRPSDASPNGTHGYGLKPAVVEAAHPGLGQLLALWRAMGPGDRVTLVELAAEVVEEAAR